MLPEGTGERRRFELSSQSAPQRNLATRSRKASESSASNPYEDAGAVSVLALRLLNASHHAKAGPDYRVPDIEQAESVLR